MVPVPGWGHLPRWVLLFQAGLVATAWVAGGRGAWLIALALAAIPGIWAWLRCLGHGRAIRDTPTSRVGSAAQGYVELAGTARPLSDTQLLSPMTGLPCLWYRYQADKRVNDRWVREEAGESDLEFLLDDGSGRCALDPQGARILTQHRETREVGDRRYTEELLLSGDRLYAIGQFRSWHPAQQPSERSTRVGDILNDWKSDQQALHQRFDLDGDGRIDPQEWQLARQAAGREADRAQAAQTGLPVRHTLTRPPRGRLYLISNQPPDALGRHFARWSALHFLVLVALLLGIAWTVRLPA